MIRHLACGILLAGVAAGQGDVARLVAQLGHDSDYRKRSAAYSTLRSRKPLSALPLLATSLPTFNLSSQGLGLSLLQAYPTDKAHPILRRFLKGSSAFLELGAAAVLYQAGQKDTAIVNHMIHALENPASSTEASMMLTRLYSVREPRIRAKVRGMLAPKLDTTVLDSVLRHLQYSKDPEGTKAVVKLLDTTDNGLDAEQRALCACYLLAMGDNSHTKYLVAALESGEISSFTRFYSYLTQAPHLDETVLAAILTFARTTKSTFQETSALRVLGKHRYQKAMGFIRELLESDEPSLSKAAFDALLEMGDELKPQSLRKLLDTERPDLCIVAADALRRLDDMSGLGPLLAVVKKGGPSKADAVTALGKFRVRKAVRPLIDALNDPNSRVRSAAFLGLGTVLRALFPYRAFDLTTTGYSPNAAAARRKEGAARILDWWKRNS